MSSTINEIDMEFKEIKNVNIETIGSLSQITRPCPIKYKSMKVQHEQVEVDRSRDNDPIVLMLTFLISLNSMSISLIVDDMS
jgi:hypothetical protein